MSEGRVSVGVHEREKEREREREREPHVYTRTLPPVTNIEQIEAWAGGVVRSNEKGVEVRVTASEGVSVPSAKV